MTCLQEGDHTAVIPNQCKNSKQANMWGGTGGGTGN